MNFRNCCELFGEQILSTLQGTWQRAESPQRMERKRLVCSHAEQIEASPGAAAPRLSTQPGGLAGTGQAGRCWSALTQGPSWPPCSGAPLTTTRLFSNCLLHGVCITSFPYPSPTHSFMDGLRHSPLWGSLLISPAPLSSAYSFLWAVALGSVLGPFLFSCTLTLLVA